MSNGFIVTAPTPEPTEEEINGGPFWPRIKPDEIREAQRIDPTVTPARLRITLIEAIATCNAALRSVRISSVDNAISTLAAIEADTIDDVSIHVHRYKRAVGSLAKALLLERMPDFDATGKGERKAESLTDTIDDCRRDHRNAIADILGVSRVTVELI